MPDKEHTASVSESESPEFRLDSQAKPAEDERRLVAESVGPLGAPPAFASV